MYRIGVMLGHDCVLLCMARCDSGLSLRLGIGLGYRLGSVWVRMCASLGHCWGGLFGVRLC